MVLGLFGLAIILGIIGAAAVFVLIRRDRKKS